jgi:hypothetical protein
LTKTRQYDMTRCVLLHGVTLSILCVLGCARFSVSRDDGSGDCICASLWLRGKCRSGPVGDGGHYVELRSLFHLPALFPFQRWGLATLIGVEAVVMSLLSRPDDIITISIKLRS